MAKKIGAVNNSNDNELKVESLAGLGDDECAERIAQHFASVSQESSPLMSLLFQPSFQHLNLLKLMNLKCLND